MAKRIPKRITRLEREYVLFEVERRRMQLDVMGKDDYRLLGEPDAFSFVQVEGKKNQKKQRVSAL
jgi:hypothetical protein